MKILVLADLHLDEVPNRDILKGLGEVIEHVGRDADVMIIAGDLTEHAAKTWPRAIRCLGAHLPTSKTVIFPGNHDYYGGNLSRLDKDLDVVCREGGCGFGQCRSLVFGNDRILMATLWTDQRLLERYGEAAVADTLRRARAMPDYRYGVITVGDPEQLIRPEDTVSKHEQQKAWLVKALARPWAGKTVVVTHHAPSGAVIGDISELSPCFASNLEAELEKFTPDIWLFGHTHRAAERRMPGGTLLRNVSVGYEEELRGVDLEERVRRGLIDLGPYESGSAR